MESDLSLIHKLHELRTGTGTLPVTHLGDTSQVLGGEKHCI